MIYDLLLPLAGAFIIFFLIALRKSAKRPEKNSGRRRPAARQGLTLERAPKESGSLTGPVALIVGLIIIAAWLAASYLTPGDPAPPVAALNAPAETESGEAEESNVMSGRIVLGRDGRDSQVDTPMAQGAAQAGAAVQAAAGGRPESPSPTAAIPLTPAARESSQAPMASAARSIMPSVSRMEQVGLMVSKPAGSAGAKAKSAPAAVPKPAAKPAAPAGATGGAAPQTAPPAAQPAGAEPGRPESGLLGGAREFTVHLGSFAERANAESYQNKLTGAGVTSFITETTVGGKLWYRVMSGRFPTRGAADSHGADLKQRGLTAKSGSYLIKPAP